VLKPEDAFPLDTDVTIGAHIYRAVSKGRLYLLVRSDCLEQADWGALFFDRPYPFFNGSPVLSGRGGGFTCECSCGGRCFVRPFRRGGLWGKFVSKNYFTLSGRKDLRSLRPIAELELLEFLALKDIPVPTPIAAGVLFSRTGFVYRAALATTLIPDAKNLLLWAKDTNAQERDMDKLSASSEAAGHEAARLLRNGVFHRDLHPGNVLVSREEDRIFLIDFDGASKDVEQTKSDRKKFSIRLIARWNRSLRKHGLMDALGGCFEKGILNVD